MRMYGCNDRGRRQGWPIGLMMMSGWGRGWGGGWDGAGVDWSGGQGGRHRRGPAGRSRMFASGELRLVLLGLVAETPRHGYELIKAIEELAGGAYAPSPGVVYPTLSLMTDEGVIAEQAGDGARRSYAVTDQGRAELDERSDDFAAVIDRLKALAAGEDRHRSPPIRRAIGNLFAALRHRAESGGFHRDTMHQVADILDDAARRIERL